MNTSVTAADLTAASAVGNADPTLAYGLSSITDYGTNMPFLNLMDMARSWVGVAPRKWGALSTSELNSGGYIGEDGWPTAIPDGMSSIGTIWSWSGSTEGAESRAGTYVLTYEGEGTIKLPGAKIISQENGKIVFEVTGDRSLRLDIMVTDPNGTGDYLRDIAIVKEEYVDLYEAGALFNPEWLATIEDSRTLRFMDWLKTNNSSVTQEDTPTLEATGFWRATSDAVPIEYIVALANQTGADPWINIPHDASDEYIQQVAAYVRDNLDPNLKVYVEYSNEVWNFSFSQTKWLAAQSQAEWGSPDWLSYMVKMAVNNAQIWDEVFAEEADSRVINVLGTQTFNSNITKQVLSASNWQKYEPENYVDPKTIFDAIGVTTYFGHTVVTSADLRTTLMSLLEESPDAATAWLFGYLKDVAIPATLAQLDKHAALIEGTGLEMISYEGGQHVFHSAFTGVPAADIAALSEFLGDFVKSEEMAKLYQILWEGWTEIGDGPFMQFGDVASGTRAEFSAYAFLGDDNPLGQLLEELNANSDVWWDETSTSDTTYQQGLTLYGGSTDGTLIGTDKIDFLIGGDGDEVFYSGKGNDGINGGKGTDTLILEGNADQYTITAEGKGYRITGPDGSKYTINIELLNFKDVQQVTFEQFLAGNLPEGAVTTPVEQVPDDKTPPATDNGSGQEGTGEVPDKGGNSGTDNGAGTEEPGNGSTGGGTETGNAGSGSGSGSGQTEESSTEQPASYAIDESEAGGAGVTIRAIGYASALGRELGLKASDALASYVLSSTGTALDGTVVSDASAIIATSGNDTFFGGNQADVIYGGVGRDLLYGGGGNDILYGGAGSDRIYGGAGNDTFHGGAGNNRIYGGDGTDRLVLAGLASDYLLKAESAGWRLNSASGSSYLESIEEFTFDDGSQLSLDELLALSANHVATDRSVALAGEVVGMQMGGAAVIDGSSGSGKGVVIQAINLFSALADDLGLNTADTTASYVISDKAALADFDGTTVSASYWSMQDNRASQSGELLSDSALETALKLGSVLTNASAIIATSGNDTFNGRDLADEVYGGSGNDLLYGGGGNDSLYGEAGNDTIYGGDGNDLISGGAGDDIFLFDAGSGQDTIHDFSAGDQLELGNFLGELSFEDAVGHDANGDLYLSNGSDRITFKGLSDPADLGLFGAFA